MTLRCTLSGRGVGKLFDAAAEGTFDCRPNIRQSAVIDQRINCTRGVFQACDYVQRSQTKQMWSGVGRQEEDL